MRTLRILGLLILCITGLAAIAQTTADSQKTTDAKSSSKATVYVYRYKQFVGGALSPSVYCDETELARITGVQGAKSNAAMALAHLFGKLPSSRPALLKSLASDKNGS